MAREVKIKPPADAFQMSGAVSNVGPGPLAPHGAFAEYVKEKLELTVGIPPFQGWSGGWDPGVPSKPAYETDHALLLAQYAEHIERIKAEQQAKIDAITYAVNPPVVFQKPWPWEAETWLPIPPGKSIKTVTTAGNAPPDPDGNESYTAELSAWRAAPWGTSWRGKSAPGPAPQPEPEVVVFGGGRAITLE